VNIAVVFNRGGAVALVLAIAAWAGVQFLDYEPLRLVAGFAVMALIGIALEVQPAPSWRPRYFWIVPAWLLGVGGTGLALREVQHVTLGNVVLGVAAASTAGVLGIAMAKKPGGRWLAGCVIAGAIVMSFQILGDARPEWKHPVLYVLNAAAFVALVFCGVKLHRSRTASASAEGLGDVAADA
jgi:hypothetical protein